MSSDAPDSGLLSQRRYAATRGLSHQAVGKAVRSGRIPTVNGRIDPEAADAAWAKNTRPRADALPADRLATGPPGGGSDPGDGHDLAASERPLATYTAARALKEVYLAKRAKLEFEQAEGKLVPVEEVAAAAFKASRAIRDQLLALPARLAPVVFAAPDVAECHRLLEEAMIEVCAGIAPSEAVPEGPVAEPEPGAPG